MMPMSQPRPLQQDRVDLPPPVAGFARRAVRRRRGGVSVGADDCIAEEVPVALIYNDRPHAVMMATPQDIDDFARGFSLSEAIVEDADEIARIETRDVLEGIEVRLVIAPERAAALHARSRNLIGRSGCGLCGAETLEAAIRHPPAVAAGPHIDDRALQAALAQLRDRQPLNVATGATHAAAWADCAGDIVLLREDVGRHNALDKLIGALDKAGVDLQRGFLIITSRASYEMVQKAATLGMTVLAAISAPTALAIHLAEETGLTLIGFARAEGYVVYAHAQRIGIVDPEPPR
jgi:FdhD protein